MARTPHDETFWWVGLGCLAAAGLIALAVIHTTMSRPSWSPRPRVQPAATALEYAGSHGSGGPVAGATDDGWWSVEAADGGLRLVYHR